MIMPSNGMIRMYTLFLAYLLPIDAGDWPEGKTC